MLTNLIVSLFFSTLIVLPTFRLMERLHKTRNY